MIVTDKFVFVHLPRSGGTFVTAVIKEVLSISSRNRPPFAARASAQTVLSPSCPWCVRNPWEFYPVMVLHHYLWHQRCRQLFCSLRMTESGSSDFVQTIRNALNLGVDDDASIF